MFCGSSGGGCFSICGFDSEAELADVAGELCACRLDAQKRLIAVNNRSLIIGFILLLVNGRCTPVRPITDTTLFEGRHLERLSSVAAVSDRRPDDFDGPSLQKKKNAARQALA
jgi:hypothetical protein